MKNKKENTKININREFKKIDKKNKDIIKSIFENNKDIQYYEVR